MGSYLGLLVAPEVKSRDTHFKTGFWTHFRTRLVLFRLFCQSCTFIFDEVWIICTLTFVIVFSRLHCGLLLQVRQSRWNEWNSVQQSDEVCKLFESSLEKADFVTCQKSFLKKSFCEQNKCLIKKPRKKVSLNRMFPNQTLMLRRLKNRALNQKFHFLTVITAFRFWGVHLIT